MGYVLVESQQLDRWKIFGHEALGLHLDEEANTHLAFRIDQHKRRLVIQRGPAEDVVVLAWQLDDMDTLREVERRLGKFGIALKQGSKTEADFRGVDAFWSFTGPKEQTLELFVDAHTSDEPLDTKTSGFTTGDSGMGHIAITSRKPEKMLDFWKTMFDAHHSDDIEQKISGTQLDVSFLRLNERHHSVAVAATRGVRMNPFRTKIQHMNFQANELEDITRAYLACKKHGFPITMGVGQHTNDREISFYVRTPSDFEIELGWNPIVVDEDNWQPQIHQGISTWGHKPEDHGLKDELRQLRQAVASLFKDEFSIT